MSFDTYPTVFKIATSCNGYNIFLLCSFGLGSVSEWIFMLHFNPQTTTTNPKPIHSYEPKTPNSYSGDCGLHRKGNNKTKRISTKIRIKIRTTHAVVCFISCSECLRVVVCGLNSIVLRTLKCRTANKTHYSLSHTHSHTPPHAKVTTMLA